MPAVSTSEKEKRLAMVEEAMDKYGWSLRVERTLATQIGCSTRTVRRYKLQVVEGARATIEAMVGDRTEARVGLLERLRGHQRAALGGRAYGAVTSMMGLEMRLLGVWEAPEELPPPDNLEAASREELVEELAAELTDAELAEIVERRRLLAAQEEPR